MLRASQQGRELTLEWTHGEDGRFHEFVADSISRGDEKGEVRLRWNGKPIHSDDKGEKEVEIPALGDFRLMNLRVNQQVEQFISLFFSDPLSREQDLRGLVYLESGAGLRLEVRGNELRVHPDQRLKGDEVLRIDRAIRNSLDYALNESLRREVHFTSIDPAVELIGDGVIVPGNEGLVFPFRAVNLRAVNVRIVQIYENNIAQFFQRNQVNGQEELSRVGRLILKKEIPLRSDKAVDFGNWNLFALDLSELMETEPGAIYNVSITFDRSQSLLPCPGEEEEKGKESVRTDSEWDDYDDPYREGYYWDDWEDYIWRERDDPCTDSYYAYRRNQNQTSRNILASNLGIVAKGGKDNEWFVAVTDLTTTAPLAGVDVDIYNFQQQLMGTRQTDAKGTAVIPLDRKPYLLVARKGTQRGYLRLDDGSALSTSMFDVGGAQNPSGIKGQLYGERGVWRPGDSLYLTFVLEDKAGVLPRDHPVRFELFTPESQLYTSRTRTKGLNGVYDFRTATDPGAPTGNWLARVHVGGSEFTRSLRIETVKPNRLKIRIDFDREILTSGDQTANLHAQWLHGAKAGNLKADVELELAPAHTGFPDYPDYAFDDPAKTFETEAEMVFEGRLDANGDGSFSPGIRVGKEAPGMLRVLLKTRVFEQSGDFSVDRFPVLFSPFSTYVGVNVPEGPGWNGALYSNESTLIPIVTVDETGRPVDVKDLQVEIFDVNWRWWWDRDEADDLVSFVHNRSQNLIRTDRISTVNGKAMYELKFEERVYGRKFIRITDPRGGHSTGQTFYLSYRGYWNQNSAEGPGGAEMLSFTTDKQEYQVGEDIRITLPEFSAGRALVSVESGSRRLESFWVEAPLKEAVRLKAGPDMAPNAYIHITLIQPYDAANDRPIRLYGIQPVKVSDPGTHLRPALDMADVLEPEKEAVLRVSEENGKAMTYTVAVVDEGLLDLTRFATPDLWSQFYARQALGIRTWDMYGHVLGAVQGELAGLLAVGGDEFLKPDGKQNANRFVPVVKYLGPFELKPGKTNTHRFTMPNYVGSVRAMVVASHEGAYGKAEKAVAVKKPLMVLATLPRVASPAETITLPVTVFAMDPGIRQVDVEVRSNELFQVDGPSRQTIRFEEEGDQVVSFTLRSARQTGQGRIDVFARSGREEASYPVNLQVRLPNPPVHAVTEAVIEPGRSWEGTVSAIGLPGTNRGTLELSVMPALNLEKRLKELTGYPHGCIEQTTSAVFPQLYLDRFLELDEARKADIQKNIEAAIWRIHTFQRTDGGLSYWPGFQSAASDWGSSYAGHFMLEARARGYQLPSGFLPNWLKYQKRRAGSWDAQASEGWQQQSHEINQAYRLYTLALAGEPALGPMNRMRDLPGLSETARWTLAGAYVLAGRESAAQKLIQGAGTRPAPYRELSYTYGNDTRDRAMILEVLTLLKEEQLARDLMEELAGTLASGAWCSTQTTAFVLHAISVYLGDAPASGDLACDLTVNGNRVTVQTKKPLHEADLALNRQPEGKVSITNRGTGKLFVRIHVEGVPLDENVTGRQDNLGMTLRYLDLNGATIDPGQLSQGTDFMAEVTVKHPGIRMPYREMALTQLFPSGWEIRNLRLDGMEAGMTQSGFDYQDIRDDRVYTYFGLNPGESRTFRVMLNATYEGKFFLPAVNCEAMYDASISALIPGRWVEVVQAR
ncbi:MAG: MG2 domain-containing protein [Bacteroidales bacterium]